LPRLQAFYDNYGANGFVPVAVNLSQSASIVLQYARLYGYPFLRDNGSVWGTYRQNGYIPLNYVIDADGIIRYVAEGFNEAQIDAVIRQYLPGPIEHDVGVSRLIAPSGNVDSAETVVPACSVYNYGANTETYSVRMRIGTGYDEVATVTGHEVGTSRYVGFPNWSAAERGQLAVACSTELTGDDVNHNDDETGIVTVMVYDLALTTMFAPTETVDSGSTVVPMVEVTNLGNQADMATVVFSVDDGYLDTVRVPLQPGVVDTAVFDDWIPTQVGMFNARCTVSGRWEMIPDNNLLTREVRVVPTGIAEQSGTSELFAFCEVVPNPAGRRMVFRYSIPRAAQVDLRVFDESGSMVRSLRSGLERKGEHLVRWDGRDDAGRLVGRGVYYCRLVTDGHRAVRKLVITE